MRPDPIHRPGRDAASWKGAAGGNAAYNARESETKLGHANGSQSEAARVAAYNAREEATYAVRSHVIPPGPKEAEAWFRQQEKAGRKNARMRPHEAAAMVRNLMSQKMQASRNSQGDHGRPCQLQRLQPGRAAA